MNRRTKRNVRKMFEQFRFEHRVEQFRRNPPMSWHEKRQKEIDEVMEWVENGGLEKMFKDRDNEE